MSKYPEHEKLKAVQEQTQAAGELLDWLASKGVRLCRWQNYWENGKPRRITPPDRKPSWNDPDNPEFESSPSGFFPIRERIEDLLAEHFGIDRERLEDEKRVMLDRMRELNVACGEVE